MIFRILDILSSGREPESVVQGIAYQERAPFPYLLKKSQSVIYSGCIFASSWSGSVRASFDLLAGPAEPNGLVSHLEMSKGVSWPGVVDGNEGRWRRWRSRRVEGRLGLKIVVCCPNWWSSTDHLAWGELAWLGIFLPEVLTQGCGGRIISL